MHTNFQNFQAVQPRHFSTSHFGETLVHLFFLPMDVLMMANNTSLNGTYYSVKITSLQRYGATYIAFYIMIMSFGLFGNYVVVFTVLLNPTMRSLTYSLLIALAVSDFIFLAISPVHVYSTFYPGQWPLESTGNVGCKMYFYVYISRDSRHRYPLL